MNYHNIFMCFIILKNILTLKMLLNTGKNFAYLKLIMKRQSFWKIF